MYFVFWLQSRMFDFYFMVLLSDESLHGRPPCSYFPWHILGYFWFGPWSTLGLCQMVCDYSSLVFVYCLALSRPSNAWVRFSFSQQLVAHTIMLSIHFSTPIFALSCRMTIELFLVRTLVSAWFVPDGMRLLVLGVCSLLSCFQGL